MTDSLHAYQISKRGNALRVMAEAVRWGERPARINTISRLLVRRACSRPAVTVVVLRARDEPRQDAMSETRQ